MISTHMDSNGNRVIRYTPPGGERGFSVQTLGNLPRTHANLGTLDEEVALKELKAHVSKFGTPRQKELLGLTD